MTIEEFLGTAHAKADAAAMAVSLAGQRIRIVFTSERLEELLAPALRHAALAEPSDADLTIAVGDRAAPGLFLSPGSVAPHEQFFLNDGRWFMYVGPTHPLWLLDRDTGLAACWFESTEAIPNWEWGGPLRVLLHWWWVQRGLYFVHAGAVGRDEGCALIVGPPGAGKSSSSLACAGSALHYLADDYCLLETAPQLRAHRVYSTGKLDRRSLSLLSHLEGLYDGAPPGQGAKAIVYPPLGELSSLPVTSMLVPQVGASRTAIAPTSSAEALRAVVPSTLFQVPGFKEWTLAGLAAVARQVPCAVLELGPDMERVPEVIDDHLRHLAETR